jgi:hypothetical protein
MRLGSHLTAEQKAKDALWHTGLTRPPETRAKISAGLLGHPCSLETRAKISASEKGKSMPDGFGEYIGALLRGRVLPPETRKKMSISRIGREQSPETRAKISIANLGKKRSPEARAKLSIAKWKGGRAVAHHKQNAKRRSLGFIPLNSSFNGCEGHHVDNEQVIYLPHKLHRSIYHRQSDGYGMAKINAVAYNFLFKQEVEAALTRLEESQA